MTSLHWAVDKEYDFGIKSLLDKKANVDIQDEVRG